MDYFYQNLLKHYAKIEGVEKEDPVLQHEMLQGWLAETLGFELDITKVRDFRENEIQLDYMLEGSYFWPRLKDKTITVHSGRFDSDCLRIQGEDVEGSKIHLDSEGGLEMSFWFVSFTHFETCSPTPVAFSIPNVISACGFRCDGGVRIHSEYMNQTDFSCEGMVELRCHSFYGVEVTQSTSLSIQAVHVRDSKFQTVWDIQCSIKEGHDLHFKGSTLHIYGKYTDCFFEGKFEESTVFLVDAENQDFYLNSSNVMHIEVTEEEASLNLHIFGSNNEVYFKHCTPDQVSITFESPYLAHSNEIHFLT